MGCKLLLEVPEALPCLWFTTIKHSVLDLDGNITFGFALCYITILAAHLILYLLTAILNICLKVVQVFATPYLIEDLLVSLSHSSKHKKQKLLCFLISSYSF